MSKTVDNRVVEMDFDNKRFEKNVSTSMNTIDKLKKNLDFSGASKGLGEISRVAGNVRLDGISSAIETVHAKFSSLQVMATTALANIANSAVNAGKRMVDSLTIAPINQGYSEYELKMNSIQTIMASTGESLSTVNAYLEELNRYADRTIYSFSDMTSNIGKFTNAGVSLKSAVKAIQGISNEAAVSGANANEASRAMYNFAQALSAGYVKLIDWKSIELANMATVEFKEQLIQTALELGTIVEVEGGYQSATTDLTGKISDVFSETRNFNESLAHQWMTTDVLVETLGRYADETTDIGKKAFKSAQDVKTFTQLMDTLKESVGSGWAQTGEIVVGDLEEAKKLYTEISNKLGGVFERSANNRNQLLFEGLSTGWKQLLKAGIPDEETFTSIIRDIAEQSGSVFEELIEGSDSFIEALKKGLQSGVISSRTLSDAVSVFANKVNGMSEEEQDASGYTDDMLKSLNALNSGLQDGSVSMDEFTEKILRPSGRENLIDALWNSCNALMSVINPIKEAFREVFPRSSGEELYSLTERIKDFTANLKISSETAEKIKQTFKGLFSIFDAIGKVLKPAATIVGTLAKSALNIILSMTSAVGKLFTSINEGVVTSGLVEFLTGVGSILTKLSTGVFSFIPKMLNGISTALSTIWSFLEKILDSVSEVLGKVSASDIFAGLSGGALLTAATGIMEVATTLKKGLTKLFNFTPITNAIKKSVSDLSKALGQLKAALTNFSTGLEASVLVKLAIAIAVLSSALKTLSEIKLKNLPRAIAALGALLAMVRKFMKSLLSLVGVSSKKKGKIGKPDKSTLTGIKSLKRVATALILLAVSMDILANAITKLSKISWNGIAKGLSGVGGGLLELVGAAKLIGKSKISLKTAVALIMLAKACKTLGDAIGKFAVLSWDEIAHGLTSMGGALLELSGVIIALSKLAGFKSLFGAGAMAIIISGLDETAMALKKFGDMPWSHIAKGLTAMGTALSEIFGALTGVSKLAGSSAIFSGASIWIVIQGLEKLSNAMLMLGTLSWNEVGKSSTAMGAALGEIFGALTGVSKLAGSSMSKLQSIFSGASIWIVIQGLKKLSNAMLMLSSMSWGEMGRSATAMGAALGEIFGALTGVSKLAGSSTSKLQSIFSGASIWIVIQGLEKLSSAMLALGSMSWGEMGRGLIAMGGALAEIAVVSGALGKLAGLSGILGAATIWVAVQGLEKLVTAFLKFSSVSWGEMGRGLIAMGGALLEVGVISGALGKLAGLSGILGAATIWVSVQGLDQLANALLKFGSMSWSEVGRGLTAMGGALLEVGAISGALGKLAGLAGIIGGAAIWVSVQGLDQLANALLKFGSMSWKEVENGITAMGEALGTLAAGSFINSLGILGSASIAVVAEPLGVLAESVKKWKDVKVPSNLEEDLASLAKGVGSFTWEGWGADSIKKVAAPLGILAESVGKWQKAEVSEKTITGIRQLGKGLKAWNWVFLGATNIKQAASPISKLATSIKKWKDVTIPDNLANNLGKLGEGLQAFNWLFSAVENVKKVATPLGQLAKSVIAWKDVAIPENLPGGLSSLGEGIKSFKWAFLEIDNLKNIVGPLGNLATSVKKWKDVTVPENLKYNLQIISDGLKAFENLFVDGASLETIVGPFGTLADSVKKWQDITIPPNLNEDLHSLADGINSFNHFDEKDVGAAMNAIKTLASSASKLNEINYEQLIAGINSMKSTLMDFSIPNTDTLTKQLKSIANKINDVSKSFKKGGKEAGSQFVKALKQALSSVDTAISTTCESAASTARSSYHSFYSAGAYLVDGFAKGISDNISKAKAKAEKMAGEAAKAAKKKLNEKSPSKVGQQIGNFFGLGFVNGIGDSFPEVTSTSTEMASLATDALSSAISRISDAVDSDLEYKPTIHPIMDLSDVTAGANTISGMMQFNPTFGSFSNIRAINSLMSQRNQNGSAAEVVSAIDRLHGDLGKFGNTSYNINGITYDDGSNISEAVQMLVRAANVKRRV